MPSKFTASLAAGRPFVVAGSPRSALADAIQRHGVGWVLDDSNIPATAAVPRELAQDREKLALIQQRCRTTYSKEFSYSSVLDRWNEELCKLLETKRTIRQQFQQRGPSDRTHQ